ncbi:MAG: hypothetical protein Kow0079_04250 [Vicingaceae bacterium]
MKIKNLDIASEMLKSIAHPLRLEIIALLSEKEQLNVTEIYTTLNIEQAVASHHLNIMKNNGVVERFRDGKNCMYQLKNPKISNIITCINSCC